MMMVVLYRHRVSPSAKNKPATALSEIKLSNKVGKTESSSYIQFIL